MVGMNGLNPSAKNPCLHGMDYGWIADVPETEWSQTACDGPGLITTTPSDRLKIVKMGYSAKKLFPVYLRALGEMDTTPP